MNDQINYSAGWYWEDGHLLWSQSIPDLKSAPATMSYLLIILAWLFLPWFIAIFLLVHQRTEVSTNTKILQQTQTFILKPRPHPANNKTFCLPQLKTSSIHSYIEINPDIYYQTLKFCIECKKSVLNLNIFHQIRIWFKIPQSPNHHQFTTIKPKHFQQTLTFIIKHHHSH